MGESLVTPHTSSGWLRILPIGFPGPIGSFIESLTRSMGQLSSISTDTHHIAYKRYEVLPIFEASGRLRCLQASLVLRIPPRKEHTEPRPMFSPLDLPSTIRHWEGKSKDAIMEVHSTTAPLLTKQLPYTLPFRRMSQSDYRPQGALLFLLRHSNKLQV